MDPTSNGPWLIDLNVPPPPEPEPVPVPEVEDSTSGGSGAHPHSPPPPPPEEAAADKPGQVDEAESRNQPRADEDGLYGAQEEGEEEINSRKRRRVGEDSLAPAAVDGVGGVQGVDVEVWRRWGEIVQMAACESGDDGIVDWKELMIIELIRIAGSTAARNGFRRDEEEMRVGNNNNAAEEVSGKAMSGQLPAAVEAAPPPWVVTTKSGRVRKLPNKYKDSVLYQEEGLPPSRCSRSPPLSSSSSSSPANNPTPRRSRK